MATLAQLIERIRQRTDTVGSEFVTDAEITQLINTAYKELYALLVRKSLQRAESVQTIVADGSAFYPLNSDFVGLLGVYRVLGDERLPLKRHSDRFRPGSRQGDAVSYRLVNSTVELYPQPTSGEYELVYVPLPGELTDPTDELDGVLGWEEFVILDAAICVLEKEESDTTKLERKRGRILQRIEDEAQLADLHSVVRIEDTRDYDTLADPASLGRRIGVGDWDW
jgi:hypothetical protein